MWAHCQIWKHWSVPWMCESKVPSVWRGARVVWGAPGHPLCPTPYSKFMLGRILLTIGGSLPSSLCARSGKIGKPSRASFIRYFSCSTTVNNFKNLYFPLHHRYSRQREGIFSVRLSEKCNELYFEKAIFICKGGWWPTTASHPFLLSRSPPSLIGLIHS
jgi:hypothetical protein